MSRRRCLACGGTGRGKEGMCRPCRKKVRQVEEALVPGYYMIAGWTCIIGDDARITIRGTDANGAPIEEEAL